MKSSRRKFLQTAGAAVPSLALLTSGSPVEAALTDNQAQTPTGDQQHGAEAKQPSQACSEYDQAPPDSRRAQYEAAYKRLKDEYSLDRVASEKIEVGWDDLVGMAFPLSKQIPVQPRLHYQIIFLHPDLSLTLGRHGGAFALGFALGTPARFPGIWEVERKLSKGYLPIIQSEWKSGSIVVNQTAFGFLPDDDKVVTGKERQYVMVRVALTNAGQEPQKTVLKLFVGKGGVLEGNSGGNLTSLSGLFHGASHHPFMASKARWRQGSLGIRMQGDGLFIKERTLLTFKSNAPTKTTFSEGPGGDGVDASCGEELSNCLQFEVNLEANETREIDIVAAGSPFSQTFVRKDYYEKKAPANDYDSMTAVTFASALARAESQLDAALAGGMKWTTPEPRLNNIYKGLILSGLSCISKNPEYDYLEPYQTPFLWEVLPWEQAFHVNAMSSLGFPETAKGCLRFFTDQQNGVGANTANHGPVEAKSIQGSYPGQSSSDWMNFTGSTLWMLAVYYHYTRDTEWLQKNSAGILAAWAWIQRERDRTRVLDDQGKKADYYGLLPPGRAGDWPEGSYLFTFTDNYTWCGMSEIATAFRDARLPEAGRLTKEAEEYRQCILDVMHQEELIDPETGQLLVPNAVFYKKGYRASWWMADGPIQLFRTGFLKPDDKRFESTYEITKLKHGVLMGMHETYGHPEWYNNQTDHTYFNCYLARGEYEKALLTCYSGFVYSMSPDCFQTQERTVVFDSNVGTYHINASNIGRLLQMMKTMVIDEQQAGELWLLRGCPRRWLEAGKTIDVEDAPTLRGRASIQVEGEGANGEIHVDLILENHPSKQHDSIVLRIPHPDRKPLKRVSVNGKNWTAFDAGKETVNLQPGGDRYHVVAGY